MNQNSLNFDSVKFFPIQKNHLKLVLDWFYKKKSVYLTVLNKNYLFVFRFAIWDLVRKQKFWHVRANTSNADNMNQNRLSTLSYSIPLAWDVRFQVHSTNKFFSHLKQLNIEQRNNITSIRSRGMARCSIVTVQNKKNVASEDEEQMNTGTRQRSETVCCQFVRKLMFLSAFRISLFVSFF